MADKSVNIGCCLWCKDTNFNANHNDGSVWCISSHVVVYGAKILILMQITTTDEILMYLQGCCLWCKDTNFNANHNKTTITMKT